MKEITITGKFGNIYSFTGDYNLKKGDKVYTSPPQRQWVGLTDKEKHTVWLETNAQYGRVVWNFADAIEAKLKEKNT